MGLVLIKTEGYLICQVTTRIGLCFGSTQEDSGRTFPIETKESHKDTISSAPNKTPVWEHTGQVLLRWLNVSFDHRAVCPGPRKSIENDPPYKLDLEKK